MHRALPIVVCGTALAAAQMPPPRPGDGPWNRDVAVWRLDPRGEPEKVATFERAGVPSLARLADGRLIAAHQHFPADDPDNFDTVAVRFSADEGRTWTPPRVISVAGLPEWMRFPFDPTLVPLPDGRVRLYFTGNRRPGSGRSVPAIYSAISSNGVTYVFEAGVRFAITNRPVIDCAAVWHGGTIHLFAPDNGAMEPRPGDGPRPRAGPPGRGGAAYHAVSRDGLNFERLADVQIPGPRRWLGNVVSDAGRLVFFGTEDSTARDRPGAGVWMATSADGITWSAPTSLAVRGADPAAVRLRDGAWLIAATTGPVRRESPPFGPRREAPPPDLPRPTIERLERSIPPDAGSTNAPLLIGIGLHIEPFGATPNPRVGAPPPRPPPRDRMPRPGPGRLDYADRGLLQRHIEDIRRLANLVERHGGHLTVQAQTPFTRILAETGDPLLADLERRGHEIALHFHENAHLGPDCERLDVATWAAVMRDEIEWIRRAGARGPIRYWSGGNLYTGVLAAAAAAGLDVMSDHKNPRRQSTDPRLLGVHPWRPAGGPAEDDVEAFARHDPRGPIVYLPDGKFARADFAGMRRSEATGGDWRYFDTLTEGLELSLRAARPDRVNVFHITVHPGEFRGRPDQPFAVIEAWLEQVVAPLMRDGRARWATFSQMADAYIAWERAHPNDPPLPPATAASSPGTNATNPPRAFVTFVVNAHDWACVDRSADTVERLIAILQRHHARGDFYLTAPLVERYLERRPDTIRLLRESGMTISYHVRPPHPLWRGFDTPLRGLSGDALASRLRDYETFALDLRTGDLDRTRPGGLRLVSETFGRPPVAIGTSDAPPPVADAHARVCAALGAKVRVVYHESGTDPNRPFVFRDGLLIRPSDFSVTRVPLPNRPDGLFWWAGITGPNGDRFDPVRLYDRQMAEWTGRRPPFVTALIHENDFYRRNGPGWNAIYFDGEGRAARPKQPPYDIATAPTGGFRSDDEAETIFCVWERLVAHVSTNAAIVTSEDIHAMAVSAGG